jgi:hypothetical protein
VACFPLKAAEARGVIERPGTPFYVFGLKTESKPL